MFRATKLPFTLTILLVSLFAICAGSFADEIVIERKANTFGDFACSNCDSLNSTKLDLINGNITAGDLWREFNRQGIDSVERLTFYVALEQVEDSTGFGLQPVEFKIDNFLASSEGDSLVLHDYGPNSSIPVAKLELTLPYDFMEEFSAESKTPVEFTAANGDKAANPKVSIGYDSGIGKPQITLIGFAGFWIVVFVLFNRLTKPSTGKPDNVSLKSTSNRQAISA